MVALTGTSAPKSADRTIGHYSGCEIFDTGGDSDTKRLKTSIPATDVSILWPDVDTSGRGDRQQALDESPIEGEGCRTAVGKTLYHWRTVCRR